MFKLAFKHGLCTHAATYTNTHKMVEIERIQQVYHNSTFLAYGIIIGVLLINHIYLDEPGLVLASDNTFPPSNKPTNGLIS